MQGRDLDALVQHGAFAGGRKWPPHDVRFPVLRRMSPSMRGPSPRPGPTEDGLGLMVPVDDRAGGVHADEGLIGAVEMRAEALFAGPQPLLGQAASVTSVHTPSSARPRPPLSAWGERGRGKGVAASRLTSTLSRTAADGAIGPDDAVLLLTGLSGAEAAEGLPPARPISS